MSERTWPLNLVIDRTESGLYRVALPDSEDEIVAEAGSLGAVLDILRLRLEPSPGVIRPDPRPVRFDQDGRLFEMDGTPIVHAGLEPEKIKQGIAEFEAGQGKPLDEVLAELRRR